MALSGNADFGIPYAITERGTFRVYEQNRHLLTFGPTRSGKGSTVICPVLLEGVPHSVLLIDPKGQNAAITARRRRELGQNVFLLNPFNELKLGTARFNPLAGLRIEQPNIVADVRSLADALIVSSPKDPHWTDSALDLVTALLLYLIATKPGEATLPDMRRLLTQTEGMFIDTIRTMVLMRQHPFIYQPAARFGVSSKEIDSVRSTAITQTFFLDDPSIAHVLSGNDFSMAQLKQQPTTVYVSLPGRYIDAYSRFFRLVVTSALDQLTAKPGGHKTLFILDEFATLQNLGAVSRAFGFAAGYNVQVWPFLQDLPQLKAIYGDRWESFFANAGMVQFFTPNDLTTAQYLEVRGGTRLYLDSKTSTGAVTYEQKKQGLSGVSTSYSTEKTPLLSVQEVMNMTDREQYVLFSGKHAIERTTRFPYWDVPRLKGTFDPDPFHL